jgi:hypothetical protein
MNVPIGSAGPAFTSTRATKRASPAVTPPEDGGAALPAADDKTTAEPTQAFPWSHVKEGPDFPDVGLWHVPKWMAEQQERLAAQQKLATQRLVEQQIKQQEALTKQLMGHLAAPLSAPTGVKTETLTGEDQLDADLNMFERHLNAEDLQFDEADLGWNETEFFSLGESVFN